jgi:hypothetical protein
MSDGFQALATSRVTSGGTARCSSQFSVGGVAVRLTGDDSAAVELVPSLLAFRSKPGRPDIRARVEWIDKLTAAPGAELFDSGALWRLYECEAGFQFDFRAPVFGEQPYKRLLVDHDFCRATLQMSAEVSAAFPYAVPLGYPLDELLIMHRLTREKAIELHSCGIVREDGTGNLFVGHSGAGKSTTTRLWMEREDVEILSDDRIIVRQDSAQDENAIKQVPHRAFSSVRNDKAFVRNDKGKMRMYGTPWHGEAAYASPGSARLARIFILEHGRGNVLTRLSPSQAVAELFARSFVPFHRHEYVESALEFLQELVDAVPCYRYAFEPNEAAVERILELRD